MAIIHSFTLDELDNFPAIAWDFDKTLIMNPHSDIYRKYILNNIHKKHYIVTHRSHGIQLRIFDDMCIEFGNENAQQLMDVFACNIHSVPDVLFSYYSYDIYSSKSGLITDMTMINKFLEWKGLVCYELGVNILIDDDISLTKRGCEKYNIDLFNSYGLKK